MKTKDMYREGNELNEGESKINYEWLYRMDFEKSPDAKLMLKERRIIDCNESAVRFFGYDSKEELLGGMPYLLSPIIQTDGKPSMVKGNEMLTLVEKKGSHRFEWIHKTKEGKSFFAEVVLTLLPIEGERVISASLQDITERKGIQEVLEEKEEFYRSLFHNNHAIMLLADPDNGEIIDVNPAACFFYGYDRQTFLTMNVKDISTSSEKKIFSTIEDVRFHHGKHYYLKDRIANGEIKDIEIYSGPIRVKNKELLYSIIHDITEKNRTMTALEASEKKFKELFHNANDMIFLHGYDENKRTGKIMEVNDIACMKLGYRREELLKMTPWELNVEDMRRFVPENTKRILKEGHATFETVMQTKDKKRIAVEINAHMFKLLGQDVNLSVVRDITERKETMKLLGETIAYDKLKTEFFSNISHEFRTPLNVIFGTLQLMELCLQRGDGDLNIENIERYVKRMKQNGCRLLRLVNNLIDITKIDSGYYEVQMQNYDIVHLVEDITLSVAEYVETKEIGLVFDTDLEERILACDPDAMERVVLNLLANAIKFTNPGGTIQVYIHDQGNHISISVTDTGIGIPKEKLDSIFERFRQVDKTLTRNHEGSGIGLSLTKSLIELHDGTIKVESELGKGSKFIIELPIRMMQNKAEDSHFMRNAQQSKIERIHIEFSDIYSINI
ncbi:PAS domain S-box-containing protein [Anaerosolibacter carboniphilus]|uniref:histidine kinase n=1 Tax=Anaerosolibacter carboniphilus TaxID=1417629 RepID=A0A841KTX4_9FIRM|nr:PAS domain-containing sensor histidine kinase [Anaerosolibacter carboniphilus]MBB6216881.1 PAS domain S-box-containing protein [Anaerosolibacter carboniphilus]